MRKALKWSGVILAASVVDLLARFGGPFNLTRILWIEALLFPAVGISLLYLFKISPRPSGFRRGVQVVIIVSFFLAGIRSGLWALGVPVGRANIVVLLAAVLGWVGLRVGRSRTGRGLNDMAS